MSNSIDWSIILSAVKEIQFERVRSKRLFEEVSEQITQKIANGSLKIGDKLPSERYLSMQMGISRSALREALRSLEFAGLICQAKGASGGSFILESEMGLLQPFQIMRQAGQFSYSELMIARIEIQDIIIRLASENATVDDLDLLDKDVVLTKQYLQQVVGDIDHKITQNFYSLLAEIANNRVFAIIVKALSYMVPQNPPLNMDIICVRETFICHLRGKDTESARRIMRNHLQSLATKKPSTEA